jgi:hypothetical protein
LLRRYFFPLPGTAPSDGMLTDRCGACENTVWAAPASFWALATGSEAGLQLFNYAAIRQCDNMGQLLTNGPRCAGFVE